MASGNEPGSGGRLEFYPGSGSECTAIADGLHLVLDGSADSPAVQRVETHLRTCTSCAREMERLRGLGEGLRRVAVVEPPAALWERVREEAALPGRGAAPLATLGDPARNGILGRWAARALLFAYDGDLERRVAQTGSCREVGTERHGSVALAAGAGLCLLSLSTGWPLLGLPLLWLASTRLETRWGERGALAIAVLGGAAGTAWEAVRAVAGLAPAPFGLAGAAAALAVAQWAAAPRLRADMFGVFRVPAVVRTLGVVLAAGALARPDLVGAWAALPLVAGAAIGWLAASRGAA